MVGERVREREASLSCYILFTLSLSRVENKIKMAAIWSINIILLQS